jgi:hypothetical protein
MPPPANPKEYMEILRSQEATGSLTSLLKVSFEDLGSGSKWKFEDFITFRVVVTLHGKNVIPSILNNTYSIAFKHLRECFNFRKCKDTLLEGMQHLSRPKMQ